MISSKKLLPQKTTAFILIICLISSIVGLTVLFPHKAQAGGKPVIDGVHIATHKSVKIKDFIWQAATFAKQVVGVATQLWDKAKQMLEWAVGKALNTLLHRLLANMTNDITNWIQNGEEPRFISEGLSDYLWDVADQAGGDFVENYLGLGWMCDPFDMEIKKALQDVPTFEEEVTCTLSDVVDNIDDFYNDFSKGGWKGWIELTKPQNNFYGAYFASEKKRIEEIEKAQAEAEADALMGKGALSMKDCKWYDKNGNLMEEQTDVRGQPAMPQTCIDNTELRPCTYKCETLTPSSLVDETAKKASTNYMDQLNAQIAAATEKAGPFQVYVQAIANALINRVMTEGVGFLRAGTEDDPRGSFTRPKYGDLGAATSTPEIVDSQEVMNKISDAETLLGLLKDCLEYYSDKIKKSRQDRMDYLNEALDYYNDYTIPTLDNVISACGKVKFKGSIAWAKNKKSEIENTTIPAIEAEIEDLKASINSSTDIDTSIDAVQAYIDAANDWLDTWEDVSGNSETDLDNNETPDLEEAQTIMDDAEEYAIETVQDLITLLSATTCTSSNFEELAKDVEELIYDAGQEEIDLGNTENVEKAEAERIKGEADTYGVQCGNYKPIKVEVTVTIENPEE